MYFQIDPKFAPVMHLQQITQNDRRNFITKTGRGERMLHRIYPNWDCMYSYKTLANIQWILLVKYSLQFIWGFHQAATLKLAVINETLKIIRSYVYIGIKRKYFICFKLSKAVFNIVLLKVYSVFIFSPNT